MATHIVMDRTGDTRHTFDPADADALAAAEKRFRELTGQGFTAAVREPDGTSRVTRTFDGRADETLFIPRLVVGCMRAALLRQAEQHFREIIGEAGARPPALDRIHVYFSTVLYQPVIELRFRDRASFSWVVSGPAFDLYAPFATELLVRDLEALWARCLAAARDLGRINAARASLIGLDSPYAPVWYDELAALERRVFVDLARPQQAPVPPAYTISGDIAALEDGALVSINRPGTAGAGEDVFQVRRLSFRDVQLVQLSAPEPPEPAGLMEALADGVLRFMEAAFGIPLSRLLPPDAEAKARTLLREWLTLEQRREYEASQSFTVVGQASGRRYRIRQGSQMNVDELDDRGVRVARLCFVPIGAFAAGDCMLAQKIALETDELAALRIANRAPEPSWPAGCGLERIVDLDQVVP